MRIAYLVSEYPAVSHTFILSEILELCKLDMHIERVSIRRPSQPEKFDQATKVEFSKTFYVKENLWRFWIYIYFMFLHPIAFLRMFVCCGRLVRIDLNQTIKVCAYFLEAMLAIRFMRKVKCGHLHVHFANAAATVALIAGSSKLISFSLSVHGPTEFHNESRQFLRQKFEAAVFIRCISYYARSQIARILGDVAKNMHVIHCGIDISQFVRLAEPPRLRILNVGRIVPDKGQADFVRSVALLQRKYPNIEAEIIGSGPQQRQLCRLAEDLGVSGRIKFSGSRTPEQVRDALKQASVFVLTSYAEGLPVVIMEAMASGVTVVASAIHGIPEIVVNGFNGLLAQPANPESFAEAIGSLFEATPGKTATLRTNALRTVHQEFSIALVSEALARTFKEYLS